MLSGRCERGDGICSGAEHPADLYDPPAGPSAAALFAARGADLFTQKVLLFHISGGTTDLLLCDEVRTITQLGTSTDLYAGQAVDRVGVKLGFAFPAGAEVSRLAAACPEEIRPKSSVRGMQCSLSGLENQCNALLAAGKSPEYVCKYCLLCVADTVVKMTRLRRRNTRVCRWYAPAA